MMNENGLAEKQLVTEWGKFKIQSEDGKYYYTDGGNFRILSPHILRIERIPVKTEKPKKTPKK